MSNLDLHASVVLDVEMLSMKSDAIKLYLYLRADASACETFLHRTYHNVNNKVVALKKRNEILESLGFSDVAYFKAMSLLAKRKWLELEEDVLEGRNAYILGRVVDDVDVYFLDEFVQTEKVVEEDVEAEEEFLAKIRRTKKNIAEDIKKKTLLERALSGVRSPQKKGTTEVIDLLKNRYEVTFGEKMPFSGAKENSLAKRFLLWCDNDVKMALSVVNFVYDNWENIKKKMKLYGRPTINLLASSSIFTSLRSFMEEETIIKSSVKSRSKEKTNEEVLDEW